MLSRHEEKYILTYRQYLILRARAMQVLTPDSHGDAGTYTITSVYYDDPADTGLYEKLDGLAFHSKFRARTYDYNTDFVRLERKDKQGILTNKLTSVIPWQQLSAATRPGAWEHADGLTREILQQMQAKNLLPVVSVRYVRDAFYHPGSDLRLTFDRDLEALPPDLQALCRDAEERSSVYDEVQVNFCLNYGGRDELVPWAKDLINLGDRLGSISHGCNSLSTAELENLCYACYFSCCENCGVYFSVSRRGSNNDDFAYTCNFCRNSIHKNCAGICSSSAGYIKTCFFNRGDFLTENNPVFFCEDKVISYLF